MQMPWISQCASEVSEYLCTSNKIKILINLIHPSWEECLLMEAEAANLPDQRLYSKAAFTWGVNIAETSSSLSEGSNSYQWLSTWKTCEHFSESQKKNIARNSRLIYRKLQKNLLIRDLLYVVGPAPLMKIILVSTDQKKWNAISLSCHKVRPLAAILSWKRKLEETVSQMSEFQPNSYPPGDIHVHCFPAKSLLSGLADTLLRGTSHYDTYHRCLMFPMHYPSNFGI